MAQIEDFQYFVKPGHAWFLEIAFVQEVSMCVWMCVWAMNNLWCDVKPE